MSVWEDLLYSEGSNQIDLGRQGDKISHGVDKFFKSFNSKKSEKYPQVGGGDTGDGKTYWVEHKDVDGSHVSWVKFDNKTDKLYVPSKSKPRQPKSNPKPTPWIQTPQGKLHQKHLDQLTKKIEKSKEQEQAWYKNKFPMLTAKQKQEENLIRMRDNVIKSRSKPPKKKKKDDGMGGIKIW